MRWAFLLLLLVGCSGRTKPVEVKVPVEVGRTAPAELLNCTKDIEPPLFKPAHGGVLLPDSQIHVLQSMIAVLYACDAGWRAWATHQPSNKSD